MRKVPLAVLLICTLLGGAPTAHAETPDVDHIRITVYYVYPGARHIYLHGNILLHGVVHL